MLTTHPRAEVHFIHQHRLAQWIRVSALRQPCAVFPVVRAARLYDRCMPGALLHFERIRIGFHTQRPAGRPDLELVHRLCADARHEQFEYTARAEATHLVGAPVPAIEGANHRHPCGIRCPHRERRARHTVDLADVRPKLLPETQMASLVEEMEIHLAQRGEKAVRIVAQHDVAVPECDLESIRDGRGAITQKEREQPVCIALHRPALFAEHHDDGRRVGLESADRDPIHTVKSDRMRAQKVVRHGGFASNEPERGVG